MSNPPAKRAFYFDRPRLGSTWNVGKLVRGAKLTDKRISFYAKRGWYSAEFRNARRELMRGKQARQSKREGSFLNDGGRLIYSPKA